MNNIECIANQLCIYLKTVKEIKDYRIYGSIRENKYDKYSDIDLEIDVSGYDNSIFITKIPEIINEKYSVIWYDYAPSLMPEKYIISLAISEDNPFLIVDITCVATPHMSTLKKEENFVNDKITHIIKLFIANFRHYIRGNNCTKDIERMYRRISTKQIDTRTMLEDTYNWLLKNADKKYEQYLQNINIEIIKIS